MRKRIYEKPSAEYIAFYSDEEIAADLPLKNYANDSMGGVGGMSGSMGSGETEPGIGLD